MTRFKTSSYHRSPLRAAAGDDRRDDDQRSRQESGPSWTKVYVGGVKVRRYLLDEVPEIPLDRRT